MNMRYNGKLIIASLLLLLGSLNGNAQIKAEGYLSYHQKVIEIENLLVAQQYAEALSQYEGLFQQYAFVFLRDYQRATQLALYLGDETKGIKWLKKAIAAGWKWKKIKKNKWTASLRGTQAWKDLRREYPELRKGVDSKAESPMARQAKKMFAKDQRKAFMALFAIGSKAQDRYTERRFAPHSERQMQLVKDMLEQVGYPGEKLTGNEWRMSTILCHHNSISTAYNRKDTLYHALRPQLLHALDRGEITPYSFAIIEDWYLASTRRGQGHTYGFLQNPTSALLRETNNKRAAIGLRSVELRNQLIEVEEKTGLDLYFPDGWVDGKIEVMP